MSKDQLGKRMKELYENRSRHELTRRTYTIMRLDGKAFHTFTQGYKRPYDLELMDMMDRTAIALCEEIQGAKLAYVQSDEISLVLTDFDTLQTDAWFDNNVQKMVSVSASIATAAFNQELLTRIAEKAHDGDKEAKIDLAAIHCRCMRLAHFDSRVFTIPTLTEVLNYLVWRQQDATRNSIQMSAQALYSHHELHEKNTSELQEMIFQKGHNWDKYPVGFKRGRIILNEKEKALSFARPETLKSIGGTGQEIMIRKSWGVFDPPIFSQDRPYLLKRIPSLPPEVPQDLLPQES